MITYPEPGSVQNICCVCISSCFFQQLPLAVATMKGQPLDNLITVYYCFTYKLEKMRNSGMWHSRNGPCAPAEEMAIEAE